MNIYERKRDETVHAIDCNDRRLAACRVRRSPKHVVTAATDDVDPTFGTLADFDRLIDSPGKIETRL